MKILHLNLYRKYFDAIVNGTKTIEYRDKTDYWKTRLENKKFDTIKFRNGYQKNARVMFVEHKGMNTTDRYEIKLGNVETRTQDEIKNEQANERIAISKSQAETSAGELALRREKEETRKKELEESKVTKTSMTAEEIKKGKSKAKARDIFTALGSGKAEFSHQQAFDDKIAGFDVKAAEKTENQEELPPAEQFVDDGSYTAVSDAKSSTGEDMFGGIDDAKKVTPGGTEYTVVPQDNMAELTKQAMDWHEQQRKLTGEYKG